MPSSDLSAPPSSRKGGPVIAIGLAQIAAWGASTYLPAVIAKPIAGELGLAPSAVFGAFSFSLIIMALCGPSVGRTIDRRGGRDVLCLSNLVFAAGLALLGVSHSLVAIYAAWALLGAGMALGLYDAAFATLVRLFGQEARAPITGVTLFGGFASTLSWPLTAFVVAHWDWRVACFGWALAHLLVFLPIHRFGIPAPANAVPTHSGAATAPPDRRRDDTRLREFALLTIFGACTAFVTSSMAAHLLNLLIALGTGPVAAIAAGALFGPAQVFARLAEYAASKRFDLHPLITARFATALHPVAGAGLLTLSGLPFVASGFVLLHGAGNGLITIAKGTLPLALFGATGYGALQGWLAVAQRIMQAAAPFVFSLVLEHFGAGGALTLSISLQLLALAALFGLRKSTGTPAIY